MKVNIRIKNIVHNIFHINLNFFDIFFSTKYNITNPYGPIKEYPFWFWSQGSRLWMNTSTFCLCEYFCFWTIPLKSHNLHFATFSVVSFEKESIDFKASSSMLMFYSFSITFFSGLSLRWLNTTTLNNTLVYRSSILKKEYNPKLG